MSEAPVTPNDLEAYERVVGTLKIGDWELLSKVTSSPFWPALKKVLVAIQNKHTGPLFDRATPFADTQYHRGALDLLREIVAMLEEGARAEYDRRVATASQRGSEPHK